MKKWAGITKKTPAYFQIEVTITHNWEAKGKLSYCMRRLLLARLSQWTMAVAPIVSPATIKQTAVIIFLHGLGDTGHGWSDEIAEIKPPYAKLICPTAPVKPVTLNMGAKMPAWYDIYSLTDLHQDDKEGIEETSQVIQSMIQKEVDAGTPANRIILGGFSQGAAISLYTGLTGKFGLAGVVALSGYLPMADSIKWDSVQHPQVLMCHGDEDSVVDYDIALKTKKLFEENNYPKFTFNTYEGLEHSANAQELDDVKDFFHKVLDSGALKSEL